MWCGFHTHCRPSDFQSRFLGKIYSSSTLKPYYLHIFYLTAFPPSDGRLYYRGSKTLSEGLKMGFLTHYYAFSVRPLILATKYIILAKYKIRPICFPRIFPGPQKLSLIFWRFRNFYNSNIQFQKLWLTLRHKLISYISNHGKNRPTNPEFSC